MQHEEAVIAHRQDVGVEGPGVDALGVLLGKEASSWIQAVQPRESLARLARLSGRVTPGAREGAPGSPAPTRGREAVRNATDASRLE